MPEYTQPPQERWLPPELRGHGVHIRDTALSTAAELMLLPEAQRWHVLIDVCKALMAMNDRVDRDV